MSFLSRSLVSFCLFSLITHYADAVSKLAPKSKDLPKRRLWECGTTKNAVPKKHQISYRVDVLNARFVMTNHPSQTYHQRKAAAATATSMQFMQAVYAAAWCVLRPKFISHYMKQIDPTPRIHSFIAVFIHNCCNKSALKFPPPLASPKHSIKLKVAFWQKKNGWIGPQIV